MVKTIIRRPGNKSRILKKLMYFIPKDFNTYYEPFLGSGAMYLALKPKKAILNDLDADIINVWKWIKRSPEKIFDGVKTLTFKLQDIPVKKQKLEYVRELSKIVYSMKYNLKRAIHYLFLIQVTYMGFLEITKKGYYVGGFELKDTTVYAYIMHTKKLDILSETSKLLKTAKIYSRDYKQILKTAKKRDFVYLDPPYIYHTKDPIIYKTRGEEKILNELKNQMDSLTSKGVYVMLSNSDYPIVKDTFKDYFIHELRVYRGYTNTWA